MIGSVLSTETELLALEAASGDRGFLIFKHSTRCPISTQAERLLARYEAPVDAPELALVKVIESRSLSTHIAERYGVWHESPQLLFVQNGKAVANVSHFEVRGETIDGWLAQTKSESLG
ncbi:MAG: bacillithiol system redox-active protein YtxJ [Schleiferiaceae bacterium]|jgi:bacillithiol system protein YtxJ